MSIKGFRNYSQMKFTEQDPIEIRRHAISRALERYNISIDEIRYERLCFGIRIQSNPNPSQRKFGEGFRFAHRLSTEKTLWLVPSKPEDLNQSVYMLAVYYRPLSMILSFADRVEHAEVFNRVTTVHRGILHAKRRATARR